MMSETVESSFDEQGEMNENPAPVTPDVNTLKDPLQEELE